MGIVLVSENHVYLYTFCRKWHYWNFRHLYLKMNKCYCQKNKHYKLSFLTLQLFFLGLACLASSLSPDEGLKVFEELQKARKCFVLENELHIIYQVVPIYAAVGWPNLGQVHHIFSRFLNLRIFFTKFSLFCFFYKVEVFY